MRKPEPIVMVFLRAELADPRTSGEIINIHRVEVVRYRDPAPIGRKLEMSKFFLDGRKLAQLFPTGKLPHDHRLVESARNDGFTVRGKGDCGDR